MDADRILDALRPVVMVVDQAGVVVEARGGFGGFYGYDLDDFRGASVFDFVPPWQIDELVTYFIESAGQSVEALSLPLPMRVTLVGKDGREHPVDVIPTGAPVGDDEVHWVVAVVPVDVQTSISRSLEAEMAGEPRQRVKELLTEELAVDNAHYSTRWFLIDLVAASGPTVTTSRVEDRPMADAVAREVTARGWRPWGAVSEGATDPLPLEDLPEPVRALAVSRGWRRASVTPVHVDGSLAAAYLLLGRVPAEYVITEVNRNVLARIEGLVDATGLLIARWRDQDRLVAAATRDPLTGLANRDAFADALAAATDEAAVLYIDVDRFKAVNDRYGHDVGDRVLIEIAQRVLRACRPADVVARFGGDELVVLLPGVDLDRAAAIGRRIIDVVGAPIPEIEGQVSVSIGLAALVGHADVVDAADQAMLQAKRSGRARLVADGDT